MTGHVFLYGISLIGSVCVLFYIGIVCSAWFGTYLVTPTLTVTVNRNATGALFEIKPNCFCFRFTEVHVLQFYYIDVKDCIFFGTTS